MLKKITVGANETRVQYSEREDTIFGNDTSDDPD